MLILAGILGALTAGAAVGLLGEEDAEEGEGASAAAEDLDGKDEQTTDESGEGGNLLDALISGDGELIGGAGDDVLTGGSGDDDLTGGDGDDTLYGMGGDDWIFGDDTPEAAGNDVLSGGDGDDTMAGNGGDDQLDGGTGDDKLFGGDGDDWLDGGAGDDELAGSAGNDVLTGGKGDDDLSGGLGNDMLAGGDGTDYVHGGAGEDTLIGGGGDWLDGNDGDDLFLIQPDGDGVTSIGDYAEGDRIEITVDHPDAELTVTHDAEGTATVLIDGQAVARVLNGQNLTGADITVITGSGA